MRRPPVLSDRAWTLVDRVFQEIGLNRLEAEYFARAAGEHTVALDTIDRILKEVRRRDANEREFAER